MECIGCEGKFDGMGVCAEVVGEHGMGCTWYILEVGNGTVLQGEHVCVFGALAYTLLQYRLELVYPGLVDGGHCV
jgi:hypothetical protein